MLYQGNTNSAKFNEYKWYQINILFKEVKITEWP